MIAPQLIPAQLVVPQVALHQLETWAQVGVQRVLNSLPEGLLIAMFAWAVLRLLPKQNSRTRFAVWFLALLAVVGTACLGGLMLTGLNSRVFASSPFASEGSSAISLSAHWAAYVFVAWLLGACVAMARLCAGLFRLRELRQTCAPVDAATLNPSIRQTLEELNGANSFASRSVTLATSEHLRVPAALGLWKPMIVLPAWALAELPPFDLSVVVRHEFAHLHRWDDWTNLLQKMVHALFFFHPAVWWIENRLSVEREMACDDIVVAQTDNPMGYASCLVSLLERSLAQRGWTMAQAIVHRAREASDRLTQILDKNRPATTGISKPTLSLVGAFALLCVVMLPQTPQLVAFDRSPLPDHEYSAALVQSATVQPAIVQPAMLRTSSAQTSFRPAAVIPAALKMNETSSPQKNSKSAPARTALASQPADQEIASSNLPPFTESPIEVSALLSQNLQSLPAWMHTVVFVEETQFVPVSNQRSVSMVEETTASSMPAATLWRVQVWRVTFISAVWEHSAPVPVANKI
jgi:beta-lactamase regulating signal transducer with metallopeptidase domain